MRSAARLAATGVALLLTGCGAESKPEVTTATAPATDEVRAEIGGGCVVRLLATPSHPFLAEFRRRIEVECASGRAGIELQPDPGGRARVELSRDSDGTLRVTDTFQSATFNPGSGALVDTGLYEGKWDESKVACAARPGFRRSEGTFLGAFDYCEHRWRFDRPA